MDWNAIKVFLAVCETGSQVHAAQRVGVSHATVFRHMHALEKSVGTRLFDRVKGRYVLTEAGAEMEAIGRRIAGSFEEIDRRVAGRDEDVGGLVRLTAPRSFSDSVLPGYLNGFRIANPEIVVELLVSNQEINMTNRSADLALRVAHAPPEHLWGRRILSIDWGIYAAPDYLKEADPLTGPADLPRHDLIAPAGQLMRHPVFAAAATERNRLSAVRCDDLTAMASLAAAGHGVALLPDDIRRPDLTRCFTYADAPPNCLWVLTHPDLRSIRRISLLMGFLAKSFSQDPYWRNEPAAQTPLPE